MDIGGNFKGPDERDIRLIMELDPTYLIWNPSLNKEDESFRTITFNITPLAAQNFPKGPKEFYVQLLADMDIGIEPNSWDIITYCSNYHREEETKYWQDQWKLNWRVSITLNSPISKLPALLDEYVETYAYSGNPQWYGGTDKQEIGCMIIADFKNRTSADKAKATINNSDKIQKLAKSISAPSPKIYSIKIADVCYRFRFSSVPSLNHFLKMGRLMHWLLRIFVIRKVELPLLMSG